MMRGMNTTFWSWMTRKCISKNQMQTIRLQMQININTSSSEINTKYYQFVVVVVVGCENKIEYVIHCVLANQKLQFPQKIALQAQLQSTFSISNHNDSTSNTTAV